MPRGGIAQAQGTEESTLRLVVADLPLESPTQNDNAMALSSVDGGQAALLDRLCDLQAESNGILYCFYADQAAWNNLILTALNNQPQGGIAQQEKSNWLGTAADVVTLVQGGRDLFNSIKGSKTLVTLAKRAGMLGASIADGVSSVFSKVNKLPGIAMSKGSAALSKAGETVSSIASKSAASVLTKGSAVLAKAGETVSTIASKSAASVLSKGGAALAKASQAASAFVSSGAATATALAAAPAAFLFGGMMLVDYLTQDDEELQIRAQQIENGDLTLEYFQDIYTNDPAIAQREYDRYRSIHDETDRQDALERAQHKKSSPNLDKGMRQNDSEREMPLVGPVPTPILPVQPPMAVLPGAGGEWPQSAWPIYGPALPESSEAPCSDTVVEALTEALARLEVKASPPQVTVTGNVFEVKKESDIDRIAAELARRLSEAQMVS